MGEQGKAIFITIAQAADQHGDYSAPQLLLSFTSMDCQIEGIDKILTNCRTCRTLERLQHAARLCLSVIAMVCIFRVIY
jgi:hypothetical protein